MKKEFFIEVLAISLAVLLGTSGASSIKTIIPKNVLGNAVNQISTSTSITVANTSTQILAANSDRHGVVFSLPTSTTSSVWLTCDYTNGAMLNQGILLATSTRIARYEAQAPILTCPWKGISDSGNVSVGVFEW